MPDFDWPALFAAPPVADFPAWFDRIAAHLLNRARLVVGGKAHRLMEVEVYYHSPEYSDPFAHRDPSQLHLGRWYFHRTGGTYRGGSFKGLDLAFGGNAAHAGVLIRGVETPDGTLVDGPSKTVDHLLSELNCPTVATLDTACGTNPVWQHGALLGLTTAEDLNRPVFACARVGLSLKKRKHQPDDPAFRFLFRRHRYLTEPTRTAKGKALMALALLTDGKFPADVATATGSPLSAVKRYAAEFAAGATETDASGYYGKGWTTADLCRLHGLWTARFAVGGARRAVNPLPASRRTNRGTT